VTIDRWRLSLTGNAGKRKWKRFQQEEKESLGRVIGEN